MLIQKHKPFSVNKFIDAVRTICAASSKQLSGVRPSVRLSVRSSVYPSIPLFFRRTPLLRVSCCAHGGQETSIDCCMVGAQQQRRRSTALSSKCQQCHIDS